MGPMKPGNSAEDKTPFTGRCPWKQEPFIYGSKHTLQRGKNNIETGDISHVVN